MSRYGPDEAELLKAGTDDLPLFDAPSPSLPYQPGSDTSRAAAEEMRNAAVVIRAAVLAAYRKAGPSGLTADEAATAVGESVLAVRPRVTELRQAGELQPTGTRRENASGMKAAVLRAT